MGYLTDYDFSSIDENIIEEIDELSGYTNHKGKYYEVKWYSCFDDMKIISKKFPDTLLIVEGSGEEQGDQWIAYFKNGKVQECRAEITFPPFDESKLK